MTQSPNQFSQTEIQGQLDFLLNNNVIAGMVDTTQATALVAGQAVKIVNGPSKIPTFVALAANTDQTFGFVVRNLKNQSFGTLQAFEIALNDSVMYMTSDAEINRGAAVEVSYTDNTVITSAGINPVVGYALDQATASGQLIRVYINTLGQSQPVAASNTVQSTVVVATLAQINAGLVLIPGVTGKKITPVDIIARVSGNFATGTSVEVESTNASPVAVLTYLEAALTDTSVLGRTAANVNTGAGYGVALGTSDGLKVVNNGSAQTGGTNITFTIIYTQF